MTADHPTRSPDSPDHQHGERGTRNDVYCAVHGWVGNIHWVSRNHDQHAPLFAPQPPRSPDSVRTPDPDVLRAALEQINSACTVFLTMAAKYHPDGGPAPAWLDFIRERQAEARAALHPASPPQKGS
jgi:hypothetical protein